jgi:hypothetical protein
VSRHLVGYRVREVSLVSLVVIGNLVVYSLTDFLLWDCTVQMSKPSVDSIAVPQNQILLHAANT